jgi:hypothetical protein
MVKSLTNIKPDENGIGVTLNKTGESVLVADVGRCYRLYYHVTAFGKNQYTINVSHKIGDFDHLVRLVRGWLRNGELPSMDVHC